MIEENLFSPFAEPLQGVNINKFSYEAKEYDSLVKDYDFHFRRYDPKLRIFTQPDTLIPNVYDPQSLNRYAFERNNPYKYTDPTGHWGDPATVGIGRTVGTTIITGLTAIFAPEVVIGVGLVIVGGLVITVIMEANEAKEMYSTGQRGFDGKEYERKEDWLDEELPRGDVEYPFEDPPPKKRGGQKYKYDKEGNPIDKKGDSWRPDRAEKHWDVQHKGGGYTRVTPEGNILPFVATYSTGNKEQDKGISGDIKRTGGKLDWYYSEKSKTYTWRPKGSSSPSGYKKASK